MASSGGKSLAVGHISGFQIDPNYGFIFGVLDNTVFETIRHQKSGNPSKILIGMDMGIDPNLLLHIQKALRICVAAVRQHSDKQI